jgi:hypothetical protein
MLKYLSEEAFETSIQFLANAVICHYESACFWEVTFIGMKYIQQNLEVRRALVMFG